MSSVARPAAGAGAGLGVEIRIWRLFGRTKPILDKARGINGFTVIGNGPGGGWEVEARLASWRASFFERTKPIFSKSLEINGFPVTCGGAACRSMPIADTKAPTWFFVFFICSLDGAWVAETRRARFGESRGSFDYRIALGRRAALLLRYRDRRQVIENREDGNIRLACDRSRLGDGVAAGGG